MKLQLFLLLFTANYMAAQESILVIEITNLQNNNGVVQVGLYNKADNYPTPNREIFKKRIKPKNNKGYVQLKNLNEGEYALAIYHDENADGKCNRNFIGYPLEGYCFSNNMRPFLAAPSFKMCKFFLNKEKKITVKMVY